MDGCHVWRKYFTKGHWRKKPSTLLAILVAMVTVGSRFPWRLGVPPAATVSILPDTSCLMELDLTWTLKIVESSSSCILAGLGGFVPLNHFPLNPVCLKKESRLVWAPLFSLRKTQLRVKTLSGGSNPMFCSQNFLTPPRNPTRTCQKAAGGVGGGGAVLTKKLFDTNWLRHVLNRHNQARTPIWI